MNGHARTLWMVAIMLLATRPVVAHHSYAMFDNAKKATVIGTVAKVEWENPHAFVWLYVADSKQQSGYALYALETGAPNMLIRQGWTKNTVKMGDKITVEYFPLKDGRPGGSLIAVRHADGTVSISDPIASKFLEALGEKEKKQ